jgi:nucleotidyltransferase/DNA polymerase involved in DNA repair
MYLGEARRRCPDLVARPYEFEKYHSRHNSCPCECYDRPSRYAAAAEAMYRVLFRLSPWVIGLSTDEAIADVTVACHTRSLTLGVACSDAVAAVAAGLRAEIEATTHCTASIGSGPNRLLARVCQKPPPLLHLFFGPDDLSLFSWPCPSPSPTGIPIWPCPRTRPSRLASMRFPWHNYPRFSLTLTSHWLPRTLTPPHTF